MDKGIDLPGKIYKGPFDIIGIHNRDARPHIRVSLGNPGGIEEAPSVQSEKSYIGPAVFFKAARQRACYKMRGMARRCDYFIVKIRRDKDDLGAVRSSRIP